VGFFSLGIVTYIILVYRKKDTVYVLRVLSTRAQLKSQYMYMYIEKKPFASVNVSVFGSSRSDKINQRL